MNKEEKAKLWSDRIQQYQTSGQTCKQWCTENGIPLSTMGYWIRRFAKEEPASESEQDMVFVRLPSEQEAARKLLSEESSSVRIFISDNIRIEISDSCRPELMESILGFLQRHTWPGRRNNGISFLRSHWSEKKLQWSGRHHQIKISPRPILTLHVCVLQPSAYFYKDPSMGRVRILEPDETARP